MLIIGIAGGTGSGKTTVVEQIVEELPEGEVCVISQDSYYRDTSHLPLEERVKINFDHPQAIDFELLAKHLKQLRAGKSIEQPIYSFIEHNRTGETLTTHPKKVIIVEGILILTNKSIRDMLDIKLFVHADSDERLIRRINRDIQDRGRTIDEVLERYKTTLKPMHQQFIEPTKEYADIIIPTNRYNTVAVQVLQRIINHTLITIK
ncbi:MAG TPA: uridine kinase [Flavobacteriaceae bacterium]|nr:uridine kinase [Flavobacteriaceae bacterium]